MQNTNFKEPITGNPKNRFYETGLNKLNALLREKRCLHLRDGGHSFRIWCNIYSVQIIINKNGYAENRPE